jgi:hypothetical protein
MLKKRFGEDFFNQVSGNLEIKTPEQARKVQKGDKRRGGKDGKRQPK